jgi:hypothetical protein
VVETQPFQFHHPQARVQEFLELFWGGSALDPKAVVQFLGVRRYVG